MQVVKYLLIHYHGRLKLFLFCLSVIVVPFPFLKIHFPRGIVLWSNMVLYWRFNHKKNTSKDEAQVVYFTLFALKFILRLICYKIMFRGFNN